MKRPTSSGGGAKPKSSVVRPLPKPKSNKAQVAPRKKSRTSTSAVQRLAVLIGRSNRALRDDFSKRSRFSRNLIRGILAAVLGLVLLVGVAVFSPALSVDKVLVRGTSPENQKKISKILESQIGKPLPQIDSAEIAKLLQPFKEIESFTLVSAPPHTLVVRIVERTPIAIVFVRNNFYYFDPAGVNLGRARETTKLPVLDIKGTPGKSENFKIAVSVLLALPAELLQKIALVSATSTDNVSFRIRGYAAQKVVWGDDSNAILKSRVLSALMKNQSVNDRVTYDVSSPTAPTVRYH